MKKSLTVFVSSAIAILFIFAGYQSVSAGNNKQDASVEHGKYIAQIAGCTSCHTPPRAEFQNPQTLTLDQIKTLAFDDQNAQDTKKFLSGGRAFPLPAGLVFTRNLTPDKETGIGTWTDQQIKVAVRTGVDAKGRLLFPIMPYHDFNGMADADLDAVIAFLHTIPAVKNQVPDNTVSTEGMQPVPFRDGIKAPDATDKAARGEYLVKVVMGCTDCHTPLDPSTGAPLMDKYLGGGQPYEGPWGIVYGGNITPDKETGIGSWTDEEVKRAIVSGISKDGRRLILMPWYAYTQITREDADAVVYYLKNGLPAVNNTVPKASLNQGFTVMASNQAPASGFSTSWYIGIGIVSILLLIGIPLLFFQRKKDE